MNPLLSDLLLISAAALTPPSRKPGGTRGSRRRRKIVVFEKSLGVNACHSVLGECALHPIKHLPLINAMAVDMDGDEENLQSKIRSYRGVVRVEDDIRVQAAPMGMRLFAASDDRRVAQIPSWGWNKIGAQSARTQKLSPVKVAVVDTGIAYNHPDLRGIVAGGYNTIDGQSGFSDDNGHGTHVAGIIGALDNQFGVVGVAPNVELYSVKVLDSDGEGNLSDLVEGLEWCIDNGIHLVNLSLSSNETNDTFREVVQEVNKQGVTLVCAAGNDGSDGEIQYPAKFPEPIAVAATTESDTIADFSSRGPEVDISAPGDEIVSTWLQGGYKSLSGTSMAAPFISGAAALIMGTMGDVSPNRVRQLLNSSTVPLSQATRSAQGSGRIDVAQLSRTLWGRPQSRR